MIDFLPSPAVLSLIGLTPMIEVTRFDTGQCRLFLKLENQNPAGSIKDRIGLAMIEAAERDGKIKPGGTLIEATAGNTGLGLALAAAAKNYRLILVIPDKMAAEKINHLRALGAEIHITRSDVTKGHPAYYQDIARQMAAEIPGAFYLNQFSNPANPEIHRTMTGPEILADMQNDVDAVVCGVGSGGTLTGLGQFFRDASPKTKLIVADPVGSILTPLINDGVTTEAGSWVIEGIGEDFIPDNCDLSFAYAAIAVSDKESLLTARELLRREGILGGSSTGTLLSAALSYCRAQTTPERVVTFVCDSGNKYLSKMYNDYWMADQGFLPRAGTGDLRDLISRPHEKHATVTLTPEDTLLTAYNRMRISDVSQLPVLEKDKVVGLVDESDILYVVMQDKARFKDKVASAMTTKLETVPIDASMARLNEIFTKDYVALVMADERFLGLITRIDLLNHLRRQLATG